MKATGFSSTPPAVAAFISYSHEDRRYAAQLKQVLGAFGIGAFMAHEDIDVSHQWRDRIIEELKRCDLFVALLSKNFMASKWAPQEVGFIVSRPEVKIIPISLDDTVAFGFINHIQSKRVSTDGVTNDFLLPALLHHFPRALFWHLIGAIANANSFRSGEAALKRIVPHFADLTVAEVKTLTEHCVKNSQIWDAGDCFKIYLPALIKARGKDMGVKNRRALTYQIKNHAWYIPE
jgi:TIR domain